MRANRKRGFTLVELMAALAVMSLLLVILLNIANTVGTAWVRETGHLEKRRNTRALLDYITSDLKPAIVPLQIPGTAGQSNLRFVVNPSEINLPDNLFNRCAIFWQISTGNQTFGDIAEIGYFVRFTEEANRFQLCRFFVGSTSSYSAGSTEKKPNPDFKIYEPGERWAWLAPTIIDKYAGASAPDYHGLFADHVIGFWVRCLDPLGQVIGRTAAYKTADGVQINSIPYEKYVYDSDKGYQFDDPLVKTAVNVSPPALPAAVEINMVLLDSTAAARLTKTDAQRIRESYNLVGETADLSAFRDNLPSSIRSSARTFNTRIYLNKSSR